MPALFDATPVWDWPSKLDDMTPAKDIAPDSTPVARAHAIKESADSSDCAHAMQVDQLVTIRLNVTSDGKTLKDSFQWNLYEARVCPV